MPIPGAVIHCVGAMATKKSQYHSLLFFDIYDHPTKDPPGVTPGPDNNKYVYDLPGTRHLEPPEFIPTKKYLTLEKNMMLEINIAKIRIILGKIATKKRLTFHSKHQHMILQKQRRR